MHRSPPASDGSGCGSGCGGGNRSNGGGARVGPTRDLRALVAREPGRAPSPVRDNGRVTEPETPADDERESASAASEPAAATETAPAAAPEAAVERATVRRAPKLGVFLVVGAAIGALVTLVLTSMFPADPNVGFAATYAYFLVYGIPLGLLVGGVVGLLLDRRSLKRAREIDVAHERVD